MSATPSNLLTNCSRIPNIRIVKTTDNNADGSGNQQYDLAKLKKVEVIQTGISGRSRISQGASTPGGGGCANRLFWFFFAKKYMKMKEFGPGDECLPPPGPYDTPVFPLPEPKWSFVDKWKCTFVFHFCTTLIKCFNNNCYYVFGACLYGDSFGKSSFTRVSATVNFRLVWTNNGPRLDRSPTDLQKIKA